MRRAAGLLTVGAALLLGGCGGGLELSRVNSAEAKPNNVWVFFTVKDGDEPVAGLEAEDFEIYEDDQLVSTFESQQVIQNPKIAAVSYTLLLLDVSGSVTESGRADALVDAAKLFTERVSKSQKVGVYAFDGAEKIHSVVPFSEAQGTVEGGLEGLRKYKPKDPSTNLNGAIVEGLEVLRAGLEKDDRPLKFGTLVVFSDGTDRAARVSRQEMADAMGKKEYENYEIFAIGVGGEIQKDTLEEIGRDGAEQVEDPAKVQEAFEKVAKRIDAHMKRFYLLSYCTPARKGTHQVRIVAKRKDPEGSGELEYTFDAEGFGPPPECNPLREPAFDLDAPQPAEEEE